MSPARPAGKGGRRRRLEEIGARSHTRRTGQHKRRGSTKDVLAKVQPTGLARDAFEGRERAVVEGISESTLQPVQGQHSWQATQRAESQAWQRKKRGSTVDALDPEGKPRRQPTTEPRGADEHMEGQQSEQAPKQEGATITWEMCHNLGFPPFWKGGGEDPSFFYTNLRGHYYGCWTPGLG